MAVTTDIQYEKLENLYLDPQNMRLGRESASKALLQDAVLTLMRDWTLDELAVSFLEGGKFWTHEALIVTREELYGSPKLVVVEGNRRLAALKYLHDAVYGTPISKKWAEIVTSAQIPPDLFTRIPFIYVDSREEIEAFLGFRHVTGIKQWHPSEKAQFIARLIDVREMGYREVMRQIGSNTPTVRRNYIAFRLLLQIEESAQNIPLENFQERFSVMYLSLRSDGVRQYLGINIDAKPDEAKTPVSRERLDKLARFAVWLFGDEEHPPLFSDSRLVDRFGRILESEKATQYLERQVAPRFEVAFQLAGGDEPEITRLIMQAADNTELSLTRAHFHRDSTRLQEAVERLADDVKQLLTIFPGIAQQLGLAK